jgi:hypothetical protein
MKIPLIKISGKRTRPESIIICEGDVLDGDANKTPREEKQKAPNNMLILKSKMPEMFKL